MNQLVKELIRPLLENNQKVTAVYGGGFKPPIKGHFGLVQTALKDLPEIDDFIIYVIVFHLFVYNCLIIHLSDYRW